MKKIAFIFPGQGSQYVGMGKDFYETFPCAKEMIDLAEKVSGIPMKELLFEENENINITKYTQIAMLADELAIWSVLREKGLESVVNAGLSLGEYAALVASGVMTPEDAFRVVAKRGEYMQEAVPTGGAMTAVLGADTAVIEKICEETEGIVSIANYNCPGQIVITGEQQAVDAAAAALKEAGAKRCTPLNVSGPFHSAMLLPAGEKLAAELEHVEIHEIAVPYITNVTADYVTDPSQVKELLKKQISSSVRWQQSVERMIADGVEAFIEIGPKKSLCGFMKRIDKTVPAYHVDKVTDLDSVLSELAQ
ncbi:ACP S-malonyltransferase [Eubacterium ramulus]|jgi:[acyl-carrier-protein] S-malonyltransferase|uniref:Malonyl CoA-acyl carrier protein transacylase n=1 Tax=Eubacterium ramulus TaxID=39490 RepID=A0A2V1JLC0_EUBRA|nr:MULTISPECIES: ACP S-malonyltransferase [Clostridia]MBS5189830.1 ACP S-malonyltransferase [Lachnospiraceae bacterium]PWE85377.1 ACP S-malonyltransferase [Eubacterium ramulus]RHV64832.1 [acyl-carrier-protein] S-malonyltransferase [Roseburia sp. OM02-15]